MCNVIYNKGITQIENWNQLVFLWKNSGLVFKIIRKKCVWKTK